MQLKATASQTHGLEKYATINSTGSSIMGPFILHTTNGYIVLAHLWVNNRSIPNPLQSIQDADIILPAEVYILSLSASFNVEKTHAFAKKKSYQLYIMTIWTKYDLNSIIITLLMKSKFILNPV